MKFKINITTEAKDKNEAGQIAEAYSTINRYLPKEDLIHISKEIEKDPGVISKIRKISKLPVVKGFFKK
ncbi:MAG: hypothetical protein PF448_06355 [Bacteroidales bacterium]|jgi:hypothetical protein|nr:hypothetical protein [Bacteroidales bacterium]